MKLVKPFCFDACGRPNRQLEDETVRHVVASFFCCIVDLHE